MTNSGAILIDGKNTRDFNRRQCSTKRDGDCAADIPLYQERCFLLGLNCESIGAPETIRDQKKAY